MPTAAQQAAEVSLVDRSWAGRAAVTAASPPRRQPGTCPSRPVGLPVVHYLNIKDYLAVAGGSAVIDLRRAGLPGLREHAARGRWLARDDVPSSPPREDGRRPARRLPDAVARAHEPLQRPRDGHVVGLFIDGSCTAGTFTRTERSDVARLVRPHPRRPRTPPTPPTARSYTPPRPCRRPGTGPLDSWLLQASRGGDADSPNAPHEPAESPAKKASGSSDLESPFPRSGAR